MMKSFSTPAHLISSRSFKVGDKLLPSIPALSDGIFEDSPKTPANIGEEITKVAGKTLVIQVPGAFSPACSQSHIPGYVAKLKEFKAKGVDQILVTTVNDPFVTKAWKDLLKLDPATEAIPLRIFSDSKGAFANFSGLLFEGAIGVFGNLRGSRAAFLFDNKGTVLKTFDEPDKTGVAETSAENVL
ncbi:Redoxin, partial [Hanseniaspora valbyensis NRRL Y-1626]